MSTVCDPSAIGTVQRREKNGSRIDVRCPESIILYNKHMGGVHRGDQKRGYYQMTQVLQVYILLSPLCFHH